MEKYATLRQGTLQNLAVTKKKKGSEEDGGVDKYSPSTRHDPWYFLGGAPERQGLLVQLNLQGPRWRGSPPP